MPRLRHAVTAAALFTIAGAALAQDEFVELTLSSGETMQVVVVERLDDVVKVQHPVLGELTIPAAGVTTLGGAAYTPEPAVNQIAAQPEGEATEEVAEDVSPWDTEFSLGLNGSEGNSENMSLRAALRGERIITDVERTEYLLRYKLETDNGDRSENELYGRALQEWNLPESPRWTWFVQGDAEYDEFQEWDVRVSGATGLGYLFIDDGTTLLRGRVGVGASFEFGADDEELIPEGLLGYDYSREINERSRFRSTGNLYPSLSNGGEFRSYLDAAYEVDMTDAGDWTLRLGLDHQYDSDTSERPWDLAYYAAIVLKF